MEKAKTTRNDNSSSRISVLKGHKKSINCIDATTLCRNLIATGSEDQSIRIWDIRANRAVKCIVRCFDTSVEAVKFSISDDNLLYAASGKGFYSFDIRTEGALIKNAITILNDPATDEINAMAIDSMGEMIGIADDSGVITIIDSKKLNAHQKLRLCGGHTSLVAAISYNPTNNNQLVSGGFDCLLCTWDLSKPGGSLSAIVNMAKIGKDGGEGNALSVKIVNPPFLQSLSYVCQGRGIAVALGDGTLKVVDALDPYSLLADCSDAHAGMATALYCNGDNMILSGGIDRTVKCWKLEDNTKINNIIPSSSKINDKDIKESNEITGSSKGLEINENRDRMSEKSVDKDDHINKEKTDKKKANKKNKINKRYAGNNYSMQFDLLWDEDHGEKINVISSFRVEKELTFFNMFFVADITSNLTIYNM